MSNNVLLFNGLVPLWVSLLVLFQVKHFLADYPLQSNKFMLGKFYPDSRFFLPLLAHVAVHGWMTWGIAWCFVSLHQALLLALFDMSIHFVMDRIKAHPKLLGRFKSLTKETAPKATRREWRENHAFWWSIGFI